MFLAPWLECLPGPLKAHGESQHDGRKEAASERPTLAPAGPLRPKPPCGEVTETEREPGDGARGSL